MEVEFTPSLGLTGWTKLVKIYMKETGAKSNGPVEVFLKWCVEKGLAVEIPNKKEIVK